MKTLIIYQSIHHGNTEKIAKKIGEVLNADLKKPNEVKPEDLANYDLIGFGSGIYATKFHVSIIKLINSLPDMKNQKAFIFYTALAVIPKVFIGSIAARLRKKNFNVIGDFSCRGGWNCHPFKLTLNISKSHPDEKDLAKAAIFAESFKK